MVVIVGMIELTPFTSASGSWIKSLRVLRVLRPLKSINAFPSMRKQISSLLGSLPSLMNAVLFQFFIFLLFGILGVQIFAGRFYRCDDPTVPNKAACVGTYVHPVTGITLQRTWANAYLNFDSLPDALVSLFVASTLDGYGQLLFDGLAAAGGFRGG